MAKLSLLLAGLAFLVLGVMLWRGGNEAEEPVTDVPTDTPIPVAKAGPTKVPAAIPPPTLTKARQPADLGRADERGRSIADEDVERSAPRDLIEKRDEEEQRIRDAQHIPGFEELPAPEN